MEILLVLITGALNIACFFIGAKVWQAASNGEKIELPAVDPMKPIREHRERKEAERKSDRYDTIMRNIDSYDGTGIGQEDVPRG